MPMDLAQLKERVQLRLGKLSGLTRFVLKIGDEGAVLVKMTGKLIEDAWFVSADAEEGPEGIRQYLDADPRAPLYVLVDVLEQMYREDELPQVGPLDRAKVISRRLDMAFPNDEVRAAMLWKRKPPIGRSFLFTAIPMTESMGKWRAFVESLSNPVPGFCLLPLESLDMVGHLTPPAQEGHTPWRAVITQEATGGFRHIIEHDDRMVVTRLTMKPAEDYNSEEIGKLIEREYRSTIGYVKRMGYDDRDPMDVVIMTTADVADYLRSVTLPNRSLTIIEPAEAGAHLGFSHAGVPGSPYADILHAAWLGQKKKPRLTLPSPKLKHKVMLRQATQAAVVAAVAASLASVAALGVNAVDLFVAEQEQVALDVDLQKTRYDLERTKRELAQFPRSPSDMRVVINTHDEHQNRLPHPVTVMASLQGSLGEARLLDMTIRANEPPRQQQQARGRQQQQRQALPKELGYRLQFKAEFPTIKEPERAVEAANQLGERVAQAFPGHTVNIARMPVAILPTQILEGGLGMLRGNSAQPEEKKDEVFTADYEVLKEAAE